MDDEVMARERRTTSKNCGKTKKAGIMHFTQVTTDTPPETLSSAIWRAKGRQSVTVLILATTSVILGLATVQLGLRVRATEERDRCYADWSRWLSSHQLLIEKLQQEDDMKARSTKMPQAER